MKIGFIGLGIMGRPMALNLARAGHELFVPERASLTEEIRGAATVLPSPAEVARAAEVVILMVPDTPDVEAVLTREGETPVRIGRLVESGESDAPEVRFLGTLGL